MPPAARLTDNHTDPHAGGPIVGPCEPTVLIGGKPAARKTDKATCKAPLDTITEGEDTVLIGGKPAARIGDGTAHGGCVAQGEPTVLIGKGKRKACMNKAAKKRAGFVKNGANQPQQGQQQGQQQRQQQGQQQGQQEARPNPAGWDRNRSVEALRNNAEPDYTGRCGTYVRQALQEGGIPWGNGPGGNPGHAADFGPELQRHGFESVASGNLTERGGTPGGFGAQAGDVIVFDRVPGHSSGHVAMYDGNNWISDTNQGRDPVSNWRYVNNNGGYTIYRRN
jgi:uncharacterized Zn-binding protein involved in type VI secretion